MAGLPKAAPNQARLITVPETALEMIEEIGSGAFGTVFKVCVLASRKVQNSMLRVLCTVPGGHGRSWLNTVCFK